MAKRQRSISLSFVLLRFTMVMLVCMLLCALLWWFVLICFQNNGIAFRPAISNQQVEQMLAGEPEVFITPGDEFLADYALFRSNGTVLESNVEGSDLETLAGFLQEDDDNNYVARYTYADGNTAIFRWRWRSEFVSPALRKLLPPFEYLWISTLGVALVLCLLINTLWLRRRLADKLKLFREISEKVGAQELDFVVPHAGIREYDQALDAMEDMRKALYNALSSQWAAQQKREEEIVALAHDLKTPLTLVGGNAELLLDEELPESIRKMVETIAASNGRAKQYIESLLEASGGAEEAFENTILSDLFEELHQSVRAIAETKGVYLQVQNDLTGELSIQKNHLLRALSNIVLNAIEHTSPGGSVYMESRMADGGWQVIVRDEGSGFSKAALHHATQRLWRDDAARGMDGHNGLGLWFAAEVVRRHGGELNLSNGNAGGIVTTIFKC